MVSSEELFEAIQKMATPQRVDRPGPDPGQYVHVALTEGALAEALATVARLVEIEAAAARDAQHLELHRRQIEGNAIGGMGGGPLAN